MILESVQPASADAGGGGGIVSEDSAIPGSLSWGPGLVRRANLSRSEVADPIPHHCARGIDGPPFLSMLKVKGNAGILLSSNRIYWADGSRNGRVDGRKMREGRVWA